MLCSMIAVQALGVDVFGAIAQWTDDVFHFSVSGSEEQDSENVPALISNSVCETLQDTLIAYGIHDAVTPNWFPEGFIMNEIDTTTLSTNLVIRADYESGQHQISIFIREFFFEEDAKIAIGNFEKDSEDVIAYDKYGVKHYIVSNNLSNTATWINGINVCSISGDLTIDELEKMIDSIYEGES